MTLLLTATTQHGIVVAADGRLSDATGSVLSDSHRKIVLWPALRAAIGFAGLATLKNGKHTDDFIEKCIHTGKWQSLAEFAAELGRLLPEMLHPDANAMQRRIGIHCVGFGPGSDLTLPEFHYIRNTDWDTTLPQFQVSEDLRTGFLRDHGIDTFAGMSAARFQLVQFSGARPTISRRLQSNLQLEAPRIRDLRGLANWAAGQIRAVAQDLGDASPVGLPTTVVMIRPNEQRHFIPDSSV